MDFTLETRNIKKTKSIKNFIQRKLAFKLSRRSDYIDRLNIYISDINGPRGGVDKQCRLHLSLRGMKDIVIKDVREDLYEAIDRALERASRSLSRKIDRQLKLNSMARLV